MSTEKVTEGMEQSEQQDILPQPQHTPLRSSSNPEIISYDQTTKTLYEVSLASERLAAGIDVTKIDLTTNTATRSTVFQNYGMLYGSSAYSMGSKQNLVVASVGSQSVAEVSIDPNTHLPTQENYCCRIA